MSRMLGRRVLRSHMLCLAYSHVMYRLRNRLMVLHNVLLSLLLRWCLLLDLPPLRMLMPILLHSLEPIL